MKILKIEDSDGGILEVKNDNISVGDSDVPGVAIECQYDGQYAIVSISDVSDLNELIRWLTRAREEMTVFESIKNALTK